MCEKCKKKSFKSTKDKDSKTTKEKTILNQKYKKITIEKIFLLWNNNFNRLFMIVFVKNRRFTKFNWKTMISFETSNKIVLLTLKIFKFDKSIIFSLFTFFLNENDI